MEIEREEDQWEDKARTAIALFAMRSTLTVAMEDGVFKDKDEVRAKLLLQNVKARIEEMKDVQ